MKLPSDSIRFRYIAATIVWTVTSVVVAGIVIAALFRSHVLQQYHDELQVHIAELAGLTDVDAQGRPYLQRPLSDPRFNPPASGFYWQVSREGVLQPLRSPSLGDHTLSDALAETVRPTSDWVEGPTGQALQYSRLLAARDNGPPLKLSIATDRRLLEAIFSRFNRALGWSLGLFAALTIGGSALQITFGYRHLLRITDAIAEIRSGRARSMQGNFPLEVRPLVADVNALLDQNESIVARSRLQAANLAHGLRTGMAILLDDAEQLEAEGQTELAARLFYECRRMQRLIDYHLARSRAAGSTAMPGQAASLQETLVPILSAMRRLHRSRRIDFSMGTAGKIRVACDPVDLGEILSNLLDNAGKWATSRTEVSVSRSGSDVLIHIDDDGPGLDADQRQRAFLVGERLDNAVPGHGLGLAIARDLARIGGGDVKLADSPLGGLRATIIMPVADVPAHGHAY